MTIEITKPELEALIGSVSRAVPLASAEDVILQGSAP